MRRKAILLVTAMAAALVLAGGAALAEEAPKGTLDAGCFDWSGGESYFSEPGKRTAQTFTAKNSGKLTSARTWVYHHPDSHEDFILEIVKVDASGVPTNDVLASTTIANNTVPYWFTTVTGNFDPFVAARVEAGKRYAFIVRRPTHGVYLAFRNDNPCSGSVYSSDSATGAFTQLGSTNDMMFETYVSVTKVDSVTPTSGQTGVARDTSPTATFSQDMDATTLQTDPTTQTSPSVKIYERVKKKKGKRRVWRWVPVSAQVGYDATNKTLTVDPYGMSETLLAPNRSHKVVISTEAKDMTGDALAQTKVWTFTTGSS